MSSLFRVRSAVALAGCLLAIYGVATYPWATAQETKSKEPAKRDTAPPETAGAAESAAEIPKRASRPSPPKPPAHTSQPWRLLSYNRIRLTRLVQ